MSRVVAGCSAAVAILSLHSVLNWRLLRKPPAEPTPVALRPSVSVLIPARDEADRLGPTLAAVLAQRGVDLEVIVLDDGSADGTAEVARRVADGDSRFSLVTGAPLPRGWLGKPHACAQLAGEATKEVLVFLDADVSLEPGALAACVDMVQQGGMDMLSPYPRQQTQGPAERLVQPLLQWSWLTFLPLRLAERSRHELITAANGQLLVCRADAYRAAGGHRQVSGEVIEDVALARLFKRAGLSVGMADGTDLATCRMYRGWAELRDGYTKSLWTAFGNPVAALATLALLALLYLLPPVAMLFGLLRRRRILTLAGATGYAAAVLGRGFTAWRTGGQIVDAPTHPLSVVALAYLTAQSWRRRNRGTLSWKGRPIT